jgi:hypothetical protein
MYAAPYENWQESKTDSRGDFTQNESFARDQLSRLDFSLTNNRVNRGPYENTRRNIASNMPQNPQYFGNTDRYGWSDWVRNRTQQQSNLAPSLNEHKDLPAPGSEYNSSYYRRPGTSPGCSTCRRHR